MSLRDYQQRMDNERRSSTARSRCNQSPTGSGKSHLIRKTAEDAPSVAVIAHREYLVNQLAKLVPDAQVIKAGVPWDRTSKKIVGMVATLAKRSPEDLPRVDEIITDECHHTPGKTYQAVLNHWPGAESDGYTATPTRLDGQGLSDHYEELICGPQYRDLIDGKHLKEFEMYAVPSGIDPKSLKVLGGDYSRKSQNDAIRKSTVFGDVVEYWQKLGRDGAHISFWPSIETAEEAASRVPSWRVLHSKLPGGQDAVDELIDALERGMIDSLATVDMVGEGLSIDGICSISRCRSTKSLALWMQQNGRANRSGGDGVARIINHVTDFRDNKFGMPDDHRQWTLQGVVKGRREGGVLSVWDCPECWAINRSQWVKCARCGADKPREIVVLEERAAELELIERTSINDIHEHCRTGEDYVRFAQAKGKKPSFGVLRYWERSVGMLDDPFLMAIEKTMKPTLQQFVLAAKQCGVNAQYAEQAGKVMRLVDEPIDYKAMFR